MGDFEMGDIPMTEEEEREAKAAEKAERDAKKPMLPAQSQSGGLVPGLKKAEAEARVGKQAVTVNENSVLKTKIGGGQVGLNLRGMSGAQKWRAALEKVEETEITVDGEKTKFYDGPGAKEVNDLLDTLELALRLDPKIVESGNGMGKWDGMVATAVGFLWTQVFDNDGIKAHVGEKDGIRILLELMMHYHFEPEIVQNCCGCLASLCLASDNRDMFRQVGGCKLITDLFEEHEDNFQRYPQLPYNFASVIKVVAVNLQSQILFTKHNTHDYIIRMMENSTISEYTMEEASLAMSNIIADPVNVRPFAVKCRGLARALALIVDKKALGHAKVVARLVKVVWNVTDDEDMHDQCFKLNVPHLMKELCDQFPDDHDVLMETYGVLRNLSHVRDLTRKQLNDRQKPLIACIPSIVDALEHSHITGVQTRALGFLMNVSDDDKFKQALMSQHILESVMIAMRNTMNYLPLQRLGCSLICNLTSGVTFVDGVERLKECKGMMHIKKQVQNNPMDFQLLRPAIGIIRNVCCMSPKHREFIAEKHELIPVVMSAMKRHYTHPFLCRNAASMLSAVCVEPIYAWEIAKRGGMKLCCTVIDSSDKVKPRDRKPLLQKILQLMVNICSVEVGLEKCHHAINGNERDKGKRQKLEQLLNDWNAEDSGPGQDSTIVRLAGEVLQAAEKHKDSLEEKPVPKEYREFFCYVFGGHSDPHHLDTGERMDTRTMKWSNLPKMAHRRYRPALVFSPDGRYLYAFGGHNEDEKLASVEVLDTGKVPMEWMEMEEMPTARSHLSGALQPRSPYIYAVGGNDGSGETNEQKSSGRLKSVIRFNMETNHWEPWGEMTTVRSSPAIAFCLDGEFLYVAGGSNGGEKHKSAERLQIAINKWEPIADMNTIRSGGCAATGADNCFYVMGGYDGTTRLNTCEYYDPDTGEWTDGPQMVKRRSGADAATGPDGSIYVVGGTDGIMQHSSVERLTFVNGRPTEWNLISEMGTCRESAAACFSLTKVIEPPQVKDTGDEETEETERKKKKKKKADPTVEVSDNPLHEESEEEDVENPLHAMTDSDEEL